MCVYVQYTRTNQQQALLTLNERNDKTEASFIVIKIYLTGGEHQEMFPLSYCCH